MSVKIFSYIPTENLYLRASKNLAGRGHPRPSARHCLCLESNAYWFPADSNTFETFQV